METRLKVGDNVFVLEKMLSASRTIITIGCETDETYNVITTGGDGEMFQCQLTRTEGGWLLRNGQWRTECPKGIRSRLQHACVLCRGCCVNVRTANPTYSWRFPEKPTLFNGETIPENGVVVKEGDVISVGGLHIKVCVEMDE